ncbi:MAG: GldG family protein [Termitinemataceae bacterium]|nr:MAG: GldG family protein [Termitinemataceae bacterium]
MTKKQTITITSLAIAAIILGLLVSNRLWFRFDLTRHKAYTISKVSKDLGRGLEEPVLITYFVSDKLKKLFPNPGEIEDLVREYTTYSKGKIRFAVRDPEAEGIDQQMQNIGIPAQQINLQERNAASVSMVYSGIFIEYLDKTDVIPVVFNLDTLEYDLTSRIRSLISGTKREAGVLVGIQGKNLTQNFKYVKQFLEMAGFTVNQLYEDSEIDSDLGELIVIGGVDTLSDASLYRIDNYIARGGKVLFLTETVAIETSYGINARKLEDLGLLSMLNHYGISVADALVLDQAAITDLFYTPTGVQLMRYPFWVNVLRENASKDHPVVSNFAGLDLFWPNPIRIIEKNDVESTMLLKTTEVAWLQTKDFVLDPASSYMMGAEKGETEGAYGLAASLSGKIPSFWRDKPKPKLDNEGDGVEPLPDLPSVSAASRIIVIGNTKFVEDETIRDKRNLDLFVSAADWLSNDDDIINIRNRVQGVGRLDKIQDEDKRFAAMTFARLFNTILIPLAVLIFGLYWANKRKKLTKKESDDAV